MHRLVEKLFAFRRTRHRSLPYAALFQKFQVILKRSNRVLELMADIHDKLGGEYVFDRHYIEETVNRLGDELFELISDFSVLSPRHNVELFVAAKKIRRTIDERLAGKHLFATGRYAVPLSELTGEMYIQGGTKMANLGEIRNRLGLPTADGFVVTSKAFVEFMRQNGFAIRAEHAVEFWQAGNDTALHRLAGEMQSSILRAPLPRALTAAIFTEYDNLLKRLRANAEVPVVMRSSAFGEDGMSGCAGQYETILNISRRQLLHGYRRVIASAYGYDAWRYRLAKGFPERETAMAVGCQVLIHGSVSGVVHTYAPQFGDNAMVVSAAWGLCAAVAGGNSPSDVLVLGRTPPHTLLSLSVAGKPCRLEPARKGGTVWQKNPGCRQHIPALATGQMQTLAQTAMDLERFHKQPMEIEWTYDLGGSLYVLQARPLRFRHSIAAPQEEIDEITRRAEIIFAGEGFVAECGVAAGPVYLVESDAHLEAFPHGAIMVSRNTSPRYIKVMHKAAGIITDLGSPTGHMANLCREYRVPTLVGTKVACSLLHQGDRITLDATRNTVYRGEIEALKRFELAEEEVFEESSEYRLLRQILHHVSPLNLINPQGGDFSPASCRTYHDIIRYIHETATEELIRKSEKQKARHHFAPKRLMFDVPLGLTVIDAGGGTSCAPDAGTVSLAQIVSTPLRQLLEGLLASKMWCTEPVGVGLGGFMASLTRTLPSSLAGPGEGKNLAVIMAEYMDITLRLGYHSIIIEACISEAVEDNSIFFRFLGGATDFVRRARRARCIARVLTDFDFRVEIHGDITAGSLKKFSLSQMMKRMRMVGGLICYTRQLDALMNTESDATVHAERFTEAMRLMLRGKDDIGTSRA